MSVHIIVRVGVHVGMRVRVCVGVRVGVGVLVSVCACGFVYVHKKACWKERERRGCGVGEPQNAKRNKILLWSKLDLIGKTVSCSFLSSPGKRPLYFISLKKSAFYEKEIARILKKSKPTGIVINATELFSPDFALFNRFQQTSADRWRHFPDDI